MKNSQQERCVRLSYRFHDVHLVELTASAWNGEFGGSTRLYISDGKLADAADILPGFTANVDDTRGVTFGAFGPEFEGGAMALRLTCVDRVIEAKGKDRPPHNWNLQLGALVVCRLESRRWDRRD